MKARPLHKGREIAESVKCHKVRTRDEKDTPPMKARPLHKGREIVESVKCHKVRTRDKKDTPPMKARPLHKGREIVESVKCHKVRTRDKKDTPPMKARPLHKGRDSVESFKSRKVIFRRANARPIRKQRTQNNAMKPKQKPEPKAKKNPAPQTTVAITNDGPLSIADAALLDADAAPAAFVSYQRSRDASFISQTKLIHRMKQLNLQPYVVLQDLGVPEGSVSNTMTAAVVLEALVLPELVEESTFDRMTWRKIRSIAQVMSGKSHKKLAPIDIAAYIGTFPQFEGKRRPSDFIDFQDHLESVFTIGMDLDEVAAANVEPEAPAPEAPAPEAPAPEAPAPEAPAPEAPAPEAPAPEAPAPEAPAPEAPAPEAPAPEAPAPEAPAPEAPAPEAPAPPPTAPQGAGLPKGPVNRVVNISSLLEALGMIEKAAAQLSDDDLNTLQIRTMALNDNLAAMIEERAEATVTA
jgi:hypothetical protein